MSARTTTALKPSRRAAWVAAFAAVPAALLISGLAVAGGSYAAFSASTSNPTSNWTTGNVVLADDDSNSALFTATNLTPGATGTKCIAVTSSGSLASNVKLYSTAAATGTLAPYVKLQVEIGTGGGFTAGCGAFTPTSTLYNGTVSGFSSAYTSYATGAAAWSPVAQTGTVVPEVRVFRFTYTVDTATPNTFQNATTGLGFTWETQTP